MDNNELSSVYDVCRFKYENILTSFMVTGTSQRKYIVQIAPANSGDTIWSTPENSFISLSLNQLHNGAPTTTEDKLTSKPIQRGLLNIQDLHNEVYYTHENPNEIIHIPGNGNIKLEDVMTDRNDTGSVTIQFDNIEFEFNNSLKYFLNGKMKVQGGIVQEE